LQAKLAAVDPHAAPRQMAAWHWPLPLQNLPAAQSSTLLHSTHTPLVALHTLVHSLLDLHGAAGTHLLSMHASLVPQSTLPLQSTHTPAPLLHTLLSVLHSTSDLHCCAGTHCFPWHKSPGAPQSAVTKQATQALLAGSHTPLPHLFWPSQGLSAGTQPGTAG
jgi:hypothetical protein